MEPMGSYDSQPVIWKGFRVASRTSDFDFLVCESGLSLPGPSMWLRVRLEWMVHMT